MLALITRKWKQAGNKDMVGREKRDWRSMNCLKLLNVLVFMDLFHFTPFKFEINDQLFSNFKLKAEKRISHKIFPKFRLFLISLGKKTRGIRF